MADDGEKRPLFSPTGDSLEDALPKYGVNTSGDGNVTFEPERSKTGARVYYAFVLFWILLLMLLAGISLGSFGVRQSKITNFYADSGNHTKDSGNYTKDSGSCILYVNSRVNNSETYLDFPANFGPCAFVFWGLASVAIVAFAFLVYLMVLIAVGPRVLSGLRLLELLVSAVTFLGGFVVSVAITAGLSKTCGSIQKGSIYNCADSYLGKWSDPNAKLFFYNDIIVAQNSCWVATLFWFAFSIWNLAVVVVYLKQRKTEIIPKT